MIAAERPVIRTTGGLVRSPAVRAIPWDLLSDEQSVAEHVWSALADAPVSRRDVVRLLDTENLRWSEAGRDLIYTYADGPRQSGSPVETEWYVEFRFDDDRLAELSVEKRHIGP